MRAQMLDELREAVGQIKAHPESQGAKDRFELLVRQMTTKERVALADTLMQMLAEATTR